MRHCETGCRRRAVTLWWNETRDLDWRMCAPCSDRLDTALVEQGYQLVTDDRDDTLHPALPGLTADMRTH